MKIFDTTNWYDTIFTKKKITKNLTKFIKIASLKDFKKF